MMGGRGGGGGGGGGLPVPAEVIRLVSQFSYRTIKLLKGVQT